MTLSTAEQTVLDELVRDLKREFSATEVRLYGSAARGDMDAESDIDLFVVVPRTDWALEGAISDRCYDAMLECGRLVSTIVVSDHDLTATPLRASPFVVTVLREGIRV